MNTTLTRAFALLTLPALWGATPAMAQPTDTDTNETEPAPAFRHETLTAMDSNGAEHDYAYSVWRSPALSETEASPAILFLHGYGECGTDGEKQLTVGLPPQLVQHPERWPFVVIIPQKPVPNSEWEDHDSALTDIVNDEIETERIDPDRIAITGLSQGGHGTIAYATLHPDRFRAAAPVCGYVVRWNNEGEKVRGTTSPESEFLASAVKVLVNKAVWIFHGGRDDVVQPSESRLLHDKLEEAGSKAVKLTIFPEDNHNSWDSAYGESGLAEWLVEQTATNESDD